jgi:thiamine-phosphate pyrophosphorylase
MSLVPRLHILTDTRIQLRYSHATLAKSAWSAGEVAVQYRNKDFLEDFHLPELVDISKWAQSQGKVLVVNDDPELAARIGASGVHVGQSDPSIEKARMLMGPKRLVGATVHTRGELETVSSLAVDYLGIGPIFGSLTKDTGLPPLGLEGLSQFVLRSSIPVIAIGNIQLADIPAVMSTGVHGIAVVSAFCLADDLEYRAKELLFAVESHAC